MIVLIKKVSVHAYNVQEDVLFLVRLGPKQTFAENGIRCSSKPPCTYIDKYRHESQTLDDWALGFLGCGEKSSSFPRVGTVLTSNRKRHHCALALDFTLHLLALSRE